VTALLADSPAAPPPSASAPEGTPPPDVAVAQPDAPARACAHCGSPLQDGQEWCLQCGAGAPGSLGARAPRRPLVTLAGLAALLTAGAAVAGAAALTHKPPPRHVVLLSIAAAPRATTPATTAPPSGSAGLGVGSAAGGTHASGHTHHNLLFPPTSTSRPPKIPAPAATPSSPGAGEPSGSSTEPSSTGESTTTTPSAKKQGSEQQGSTTTGTSTTGESSPKEGSGKSEQPTPITLDTDAASTYNPSNYPATDFGDPALAIDGEPSTVWTAQTQPASFPNMAEGLLIDIRSPTKVGSLELATPTRGMVVQVYGANGAKAPTGITEPGWVLLSGSHTLKKRTTHLRLRTHGDRAFRFVLVWIVKAPAASQGTPAAPGHVALSEVVLFPPTS
jgi:hypothetical protein